MRTTFRPAILTVGWALGMVCCGGGATGISDPGTDILGAYELVQPDYGTKDLGQDESRDPVVVVDAGTDLPAPGTFGAPCLGNADCESGFCVEGPDGPVCSRTCVLECPEDWACRSTLIGSDVVSLCIPLGATLCKPCRVHTQCGGGLCLELPDGTFCGRDCAVAPCPSGYDCLDLGEGEESVRQCVPHSRACDCMPANAGEVRACAWFNPFGACLGEEHCDPEEGWVCEAPVPEAEHCNGRDDDCDGLVDEDFPEVGEDCFAGTGACRVRGRFVCLSDGTGVRCDAVPGSPIAETCNGIDDNCNGQIDEDFLVNGAYRSDRACGSCFVDCTSLFTPQGHNARGRCDATGAQPRCTYECLDGHADANGFRDDGCELRIPETTVFVATPENGGRDDLQCGTWENPCATISFAIDRAIEDMFTEVRVSSGVYGENLTLIGGISVKGGYSPVDWQRDPKANPTILQAVSSGPVGSHRKAVIARGIRQPTEFSGFTVIGENDDRPVAGQVGSNSYGLWLKDCSSALVIRDNAIIAGRGAPGGDGSPGITGTNGQDGARGGDCRNSESYTCSGVAAPGGAGGSSTCGSGGGKGGDAVCPAGQNQMPAGSRGGGPSGGAGGAGGYSDTVSDACNVCSSGGKTDFGYDGARGGNGADGTAGSGSTDGRGGLANDEWIGGTAAAGGSGGPGSGGGGGGAGGGVDFLSSACTFYDRTGTAGGGGGSGGCGGTGGGPGLSGGASIAVFVLQTDGAPTGLPVLSGNLVVRNRGGDGGQGGAGGVGGIGGSGGMAGEVACATNSSGNPYWFMPCIGQGGTGGDGGRGGSGGGGGGGSGGASYGILGIGLSGGSPDWCSSSRFEALGGGGQGGLGGPSNGNPGRAGVTGDAADCRLQ
ncbi:MAG TPA: MopE-related protein [Myxococcota bacterium]|nr:MopE-related protein [Myxococcota bacterium]HQK52047.1 MopE-related protein [Myxococcota bacterium]